MKFNTLHSNSKVTIANLSISSSNHLLMEYVKQTCSAAVMTDATFSLSKFCKPEMICTIDNHIGTLGKYMQEYKVLVE